MYDLKYVLRSICRFGTGLAVTLARASSEDTTSVIGARVLTPDAVQNYAGTLSLASAENTHSETTIVD